MKKSFTLPGIGNDPQPAEHEIRFCHFFLLGKKPPVETGCFVYVSKTIHMRKFIFVSFIPFQFFRSYFFRP